jgi:hypothetical protein
VPTGYAKSAHTGSVSNGLPNCRNDIHEQHIAAEISFVFLNSDYYQTDISQFSTDISQFENDNSQFTCLLRRLLRLRLVRSLDGIPAAYPHPCLYCEPVCLQDTLKALTPGPYQMAYRPPGRRAFPRPCGCAALWP